MTNKNDNYLISREAGKGDVAVWRLDLESEGMLQRIETDPAAKLDPDRNLTPIGSYLLEWGQSLDFKTSMVYRLWRFDPSNANPLGSSPVQEGLWDSSKFFHGRIDFGHAESDRQVRSDDYKFYLVPMGNFVLAWTPSPGRGTYRLWNFDPASKDPLPGPVSPESGWGLIESGHHLIPARDYVIDWVPKTGKYALWSFDPGAKEPLKLPLVQQGVWNDIGVDRGLTPIGDLILDWSPETRDFRLWHFDADSADPLGDTPIRSGTLPEGFTAHTSLTGMQSVVPAHRAGESADPGSMDFMRSKIKHVVYYMVENRSFDHVCGWLYDGQNKPAHIVGRDGDFMGANTAHYNVDAKGERIHTSLYKDGRLGEDFDLELLPHDKDPYHENSDVLRQMFSADMEGYKNGAIPDMGGFVLNNGFPQVMETYGPDQLRVLNGLAHDFAVSDEWFCSTPGGTDVNRAFSLTGSSFGLLNNFQNGAEYKYWPFAPRRPSIWKVLWSNGIKDWRIYNSTEWMQFVFTYHLFLQGQVPSVDAEIDQARKSGQPSEYIGDFERFKAEARAGELPAFSYLEPVWIAKTGTTSYHPGADLVPGEMALNEIYEALKAGPNWDQTLLVITFDEHGGIFDHVPPPRARNPWPNDENDGFNFDIMGVRVPTILVSPMIERNTVFRSGTHTAYDSTSFLATLLRWFGVPRSRWGLGERTHHAPTFEGAVRRPEARTEIPSYTPPYDKSHPQSGEMPKGTKPHDLNRLMAARLIQSMGHGRFTDQDLHRTAVSISEGAETMEELHTLLSDFMKKVA